MSMIVHGLQYAHDYFSLTCMLQVQCDECDWWYHLPCVNKKLKKMCVADEDAERIKFTGPCCTVDGNYRVQL